MSHNYRVKMVAQYSTKLWAEEDFNKFYKYCFDDASARRIERNGDKLESKREVFEMWNQNLPDGYVPSSRITVGEQLVSFRGQCIFRVYIPSKLGKYGIKI